jgi:hypothetical protein
MGSGGERHITRVWIIPRPCRGGDGPCGGWGSPGERKRRLEGELVIGTRGQSGMRL